MRASRPPAPIRRERGLHVARDGGSRVAVPADGPRDERAVVCDFDRALAADARAHEKGDAWFSYWDLADECGFTDADGRTPRWGRHFEEHVGPRRRCDGGFHAYRENRGHNR